MTRTPSVTTSDRPTQISGEVVSRGTRGLVVVGHGTLDAQGKAEFFDTVDLLKQQLPGWLVEPALLEMAAPDFVQATECLVRRGARQVDILPLFLFAAGHAKVDLPRLVEAAAVRHPQVGFEFRSVLNCQTDLVALSALRFSEAIAHQPDYKAAETLLILVGRGSTDVQARSEMLQFAHLRGQRTPVGGIETGFLAMCEPSLEDALSKAAESAFRRIVVQPHLLFHGALNDRIVCAVNQLSVVRSDKAWVTVGPLGPHQLLARAAMQAAGLIATPS